MVKDACGLFFPKTTTPSGDAGGKATKVSQPKGAVLVMTRLQMLFPTTILDVIVAPKSLKQDDRNKLIVLKFVSRILKIP